MNPKVGDRFVATKTVLGWKVGEQMIVKDVFCKENDVLTIEFYRDRGNPTIDQKGVWSLSMATFSQWFKAVEQV